MRNAGLPSPAPLPSADPNGGPVFCDHHGVCSQQDRYDPAKPWVGSNCGQGKRWPFYRGICFQDRHDIGKPWISSGCGDGRSWRFFRQIATGIQYLCSRGATSGY